MRKFSISLFILSQAILPALANTKNFVITLDPGHGGSDNGAVYGKAREADIALSVAKLLQKNLNSIGGITANLTRDKDTTLTLAERVEKSAADKADLFVSLHANASTDQRARGVEFYFQNQMASDEESMYLAHLENQLIKEPTKVAEPTLEKKSDVLAIIEDLKRQANMKRSFALSESLLNAWTQSTGAKAHNSIRQAPFYVVSKAESPSVLVELGFISNPKESQRLLQPNYQAEIANRLSKGLLAYKEMIDKTKRARLQ